MDSPLCLVRASLLRTKLEYPFDPCRAKQRTDREAVITGAQPKQDYDPDVFLLSLPFFCSSLGGTAKCSSYVFSPHHAFLITETHTSKKWEEDRGKQDARRKGKAPLYLSVCHLSSPFLITVGTLVVPPMYVLCMSCEGEQRNPLWFPYPLSSCGSLSPLMEKETRDSSRPRPEELMKTKREEWDQGSGKVKHSFCPQMRSSWSHLVVVSPAQLPGAHGWDKRTRNME